MDRTVFVSTYIILFSEINFCLIRSVNQVVGLHRFLEPDQIVGFDGAAEPDGVVDAEALVGVGHQGDVRPDGLAHGGDPRRVFGHGRLAQAHLHGVPALRQERAGLGNQVVGRHGDPEAAGIVGPDAVPGGCRRAWLRIPASLCGLRERLRRVPLVHALGSSDPQLNSRSIRSYRQPSSAASPSLCVV